MASRTGWWSRRPGAPSSRCAFTGCSRRTRRGGSAPRLRRRAAGGVGIAASGASRWAAPCAGCSPRTSLRVRAGGRRRLVGVHTVGEPLRGTGHRSFAAVPQMGEMIPGAGSRVFGVRDPGSAARYRLRSRRSTAGHRSRRPRRACGEEGDGGNGVEVPQMQPGHRTRRSDDHDLLRKPVQVREV